MGDRENWNLSSCYFNLVPFRSHDAAFVISVSGFSWTTDYIVTVFTQLFRNGIPALMRSFIVIESSLPSKI